MNAWQPDFALNARRSALSAGRRSPTIFVEKSCLTMSNSE